MSARQMDATKTLSSKLRRWLKAFAIELPVLYLLLSPLVAMPVYTKAILQPDKRVQDVSAVLNQFESVFRAQTQDIYFKSADGKTLHAWLIQHPKAKKIVLVSHGNAGSITGRVSLVAVLLAAQTSVFIYDYRGFGRSEGDSTLTSIQDDGLTAYDYLVSEKGYQAKDIVLYGESIGTTVATHIAASRSSAGIILASGFSSLFTAGRNKFPWLCIYPNALFPKDLDNVPVVSQPHPPLLIIHGTADDIMDYHNSELLFAQAVEPKKLIEVEGRGHADLELIDVAPFREGVKDFLAHIIG